MQASSSTSDSSSVCHLFHAAWPVTIGSGERCERSPLSMLRPMLHYPYVLWHDAGRMASVFRSALSHSEVRCKQGAPRFSHSSRCSLPGQELVGAGEDRWIGCAPLTWQMCVGQLARLHTHDAAHFIEFRWAGGLSISPL